VPIPATDAAAAAAGLNQAFDQTMTALVPWAAENIGPPQAPTGPDEEPVDAP